MRVLVDDGAFVASFPLLAGSSAAVALRGAGGVRRVAVVADPVGSGVGAFEERSLGHGGGVVVEEELDLAACLAAALALDVASAVDALAALAAPLAFVDRHGPGTP